MCLKRGGDGLPRIDVAVEDDAVNGRIDGSALQVVLRRDKAVPGLVDLGLGVVDLCLGRQVGGVIGIPVVLRRQRSLGIGTQQLVAFDRRLAAEEVRLRVLQRRFRGRQRGIRPVHRALVLRGIHLREQLPLFDGVVVVDQDLFDGAGDLGPDLDLLERFKVARRRDGDIELAGSDRLRHEAVGLFAVARLPEEISPRSGGDGEEQDEEDPFPPAAFI